MVEENIRQQIIKFEKHKSDKPVLDHNDQCVVNFHYELRILLLGMCSVIS